MASQADAGATGPLRILFHSVETCGKQGRDKWPLGHYDLLVRPPSWRFGMRTRIGIRRTAAVAAALVVCLPIIGAGPALAGDSGPPEGGGLAPATRIAGGLDNPRQLSFTRAGDLLVAEAGKGGDGPCAPGPEGGVVCFGTSGAITRISQGRQSRIVVGLPSVGAEGDESTPRGSEASGPSDVIETGDQSVSVLIGLGADPAVRDTYPAPGNYMGTLVHTQWNNRPLTVLADIAAYEAATNPIHDPDSNPTGMLLDDGAYVIADAGGNTVLRVEAWGDISTLAVLDDQLADAPPFLDLPPGTQIPAQAVPTAVAVGPDGAYYVSQLTGFPFEKGLANIYRIDPDGTVAVFASGLTNVTDLAFSGGTLYAVQISSEGLLNGPIGSVVQVDPAGGHHRVVADSLFAPYGIAIQGSYAFVTTGSVAAGAGEVWRLPLT